MHLYARIVFCLFVTHATTARSTMIHIETSGSAAAESHLEILVDGKQVCDLNGQLSKPNSSASQKCDFRIEPAARAITLKGYANARGGRKAQSAAAPFTVPIRDASPLMAALRERSLGAKERWTRTRAVEAKFAGSYNESNRGYAAVEFGRRSSLDDIAAVEKKLGFPLPADYRELVASAGAPSFLVDYSVVAPEFLENARTVLERWIGAEDYSRKPATQSALDHLDRSTILFMEAGDGIGAELYFAPPNQPCGDEPAYLWIHEDALVEAMHDILHGKMECRSFSDLLDDFYIRYVVVHHAATLWEEHNELLIDFAAPKQTLELSYSGSEEAQFDLSWPEYWPE